MGTTSCSGTWEGPSSGYRVGARIISALRETGRASAREGGLSLKSHTSASFAIRFAICYN